MTTTVRITADTHRKLSALAASRGEPMQSVLERAVAAYEESAFWDAFASGYERLAADNEVWSQVQGERDGEAASLPDGVE